MNDKKHVGHDLLPPDFEEDRDQLLYLVAAGYAAIKADKVDNFKAWHRGVAQTVGRIKERYRSLGLEAAPWTEAALWARIDPPCPHPEPLEHMRLLQALLTNFHEPFFRQYEYRHRTGGNVHIQWCGPTGMAKSSCAISFMHDTSPMQPDKLVTHLCLDVGQLPDKLKGKQPGEWVHLDELLTAAGEGSTTQKAMMGNLEDTIRASQINLSTSSPELEVTATTQCQAEVILWNPKEKWSLFLVWVKGIPMGVVALPWMPTEHYAAYSPWKAANVERSIQAQFKDTTYLVRTMMTIFADQDVVTFLLECPNKPKPKDFGIALEVGYGQQLATSQVEKLVRLMDIFCYNYERLGPYIEKRYGVKPNKGYMEVAAKCYQE